MCRDDFQRVAQFVVDICLVGVGVPCRVGEVDGVEHVILVNRRNAPRDLQIAIQRGGVIGVHARCAEEQPLARRRVRRAELGVIRVAEVRQHGLNFRRQRIGGVLNARAVCADDEGRRVARRPVRTLEFVAVRLGRIHHPASRAFKRQIQVRRGVGLVGEGQRRQGRGGRLVNGVNHDGRRAGILPGNDRNGRIRGGRRDERRQMNFLRRAGSVARVVVLLGRGVVIRRKAAAGGIRAGYVCRPLRVRRPLRIDVILRLRFRCAARQQNEARAQQKHCPKALFHRDSLLMVVILR